VQILKSNDNSIIRKEISHTEGHSFLKSIYPERTQLAAGIPIASIADFRRISVYPTTLAQEKLCDRAERGEETGDAGGPDRAVPRQDPRGEGGDGAVGRRAERVGYSS